MPIILLALAGIALLNLCYYFGFLKFAVSEPEKGGGTDDLPISVIICAKNEAHNLRNFVPSILNQEYPNFEVIIINDASTDETLEVIESFQKTDPRVKLVNVVNNEAFWANKKYALTLGIKKARSKHLLFTDADCQPQSQSWISEMVSCFAPSKSLVLGYGGYFKKKRSFLNKLIRFETLLTAIQYFSYASWGNPYMGVGRNLAYTAKLFYEENGFSTHLHLRSGDDDLFVNGAATRKNTALCPKTTAITRSVPKTTFKAWFAQKRRHVSVSGNYKAKDRFLLAFFYMTQFLFWVLLIICLFGNYWKIALGILLFRLLVQGFVFYKSAKKLGETDLLWYFPFLEIFLVYAQMGIFTTNIFSKPIHWK